MDDLVTWLGAQLDEDERGARAAWQPNWRWQSEEERIDLQDGAEGRVSMEALRKADARHIARWDPARVLAEVEAKRVILAECADCDGWLAKTVITTLALPYRDRPGWKPEWAPEQ